MKYSDFEKVMSQPRMGRYLAATGNITKSAMTLYRKNLELSQELFTVISCFEIAIRNKINQHYVHSLSVDWIRDSATGCFSVNQCQTTRKIISLALQNLGHNYSHNKLVTKMDFGFWRYLFAGPQPLKSTSYVRQHYTLIKQLFQWMSVDEAALLYGLDHINNVCLEIDNL
jgi:hypothetical protein